MKIHRMKKGVLSISIIASMILAALICIFNPMSKNAQATNVSGTINIDTVWNQAGSPYIAVGNVTIANGVTLTVNPGVDVKFNGYYSIYVDGTFNAIGTETERIDISSNKPVPAPNDWNRIQINSTGHAEISYCNVKHGTNAIFIHSSSYNNITYNNIMLIGNQTAWISRGIGIAVHSSSNNNIMNNHISNVTGFIDPWDWMPGYGIYLESSSYNNISNNTIVNNGHPNFSQGIGLYSRSSSNNTISFNNISSNIGNGIEFWSSSNNNTISNNIISQNQIYYGIEIRESSYNVIRENHVSDNFYAIQIALFSYNNTVVSNSVISNTNYSIDLGFNSANNTIYHNNFISDAFKQAIDGSGKNVWNDSYPSGGNYWSDWSPICADDHDGPKTPQTTGNPDGICDIQYDITNQGDIIKNSDYYPRTTPFDIPWPFDNLPPEIHDVHLNDQSSLAVPLDTQSVTLTAIIDDVNTGQSNIGGGNYTVGIRNWGTSANMDPIDGAWDEIEEDANKTIDISTWDLGDYQICVYGWDVEPNYNTTGSCALLMIYDDIPPEINDSVKPNPGEVGGNVNISAEITDNVGVSDAWIEIFDPNGDSLGNHTMSYDASTEKYYLEDVYTIVGAYTYTIWAVDTNDNWNSTSGTFEIEPGDGPPETRIEYNWKPIIALLFTIILLLFGLLISYKRPIKFKGNLQKDRMYTFLGGVLPFMIAEMCTGIVSLVTGLLSVPPILGIGMAVDLAILLSGIVVSLVIFKKGTIPSEYVEEDQPDESEVSEAPLPPPQSDEDGSEPESNNSEQASHSVSNPEN